MTDKEIEIKLSGVVTTKKDHVGWLDDSIEWIESRNETFGGSAIKIEDDEEDE